MMMMMLELASCHKQCVCNVCALSYSEERSDRCVVYVAWHVCFSFLSCLLISSSVLFPRILFSLSLSLLYFIVCENMMNHCRNYRPYIIRANKNYVALFDCDVRNLIRLLSFIVECGARVDDASVCIYVFGGRTKLIPIEFEWVHMNYWSMCTRLPLKWILFREGFLLPIFICVSSFSFNLNLKKKTLFWSSIL